MSKKFNFYIPKSQTIPTDLRLKGEGVDIKYEKLPDAFGYEFKVYHPGAEETPAVAPDRELVEDIAHQMCNQFFDHGASWRVTKIKMVHSAEKWWDCNIFHVLFRIRDAG